MNKSMSELNKAPSRGRPLNVEKQTHQKNNLLHAAGQLLAEKSYSSITIREISQRSGVNSAMVSYYFNNKEGLFIALLDAMSDKHFAIMQGISQSTNPIKTFIETILSMLNKNNGLARLIHNEFADENSTLSNNFIERFPKKMASFLPKLIQNNTDIKNERQAKYSAFSLISLIIMPFLNKSIRQQAWQISDDELQSDQWAEHIYQQFIAGCHHFKNSEKVSDNMQNMTNTKEQL